ncbi:MAG: DinB family protein [Candidatus Methylomirabilales bacterium]
MPSILVASFIALKEEMFSRTMKVATLCPRDKLMWSPVPGALTLGQLLRHMHRSEYNRTRVLNGLIEPGMYYVLRHGEGQTKDLKATLGNVTDLDAEMAALQEAHRYTLQTIAGFSDEDLTRPADWGGKKRTALEFFLLMFEHDAHHRGQAALYLRLLGVERPTGMDWRGLAYGK